MAPAASLVAVPRLAGRFQFLGAFAHPTLGACFRPFCLAGAPPDPRWLAKASPPPSARSRRWLRQPAACSLPEPPFPAHWASNCPPHLVPRHDRRESANTYTCGTNPGLAESLLPQSASGNCARSLGSPGSIYFYIPDMLADLDRLFSGSPPPIPPAPVPWSFGGFPPPDGPWFDRLP